MSSSQPNNSLDPSNNNDTEANDSNDDQGHGASVIPVAGGSGSNNIDTQQPTSTNSNNNQRMFSVRYDDDAVDDFGPPAESLGASSSAPAPAQPGRHRWSQTVGTTIFSYNPTTRQLVPIAGSPPVTTYSSTNPSTNNTGPPFAFGPPLPGMHQMPGGQGLPGMPFDSPFEGPFPGGKSVCVRQRSSS